MTESLEQRLQNDLQMMALLGIGTPGQRMEARRWWLDHFQRLEDGYMVFRYEDDDVKVKQP